MTRVTLDRKQRRRIRRRVFFAILPSLLGWETVIGGIVLSAMWGCLHIWPHRRHIGLTTGLVLAFVLGVLLMAYLSKRIVRLSREYLHPEMRWTD